MRPTPQIGSNDRSKSITMSNPLGLRRADSKEELSPRSKMFPGLREKMSTINGGGSFIKFERKTPVHTGRKEGFGQEFQKTINTQFNKKEEAKIGKLLANIPKSNQDLAVKPRAPKEEKIDTKPKETIKKEKKGGRRKGGKAKKGKKTTKDSNNLSGRKDVVFKTLLRSIKRYYSTLFEETTEYNSLTKTKQDKQ